MAGILIYINHLAVTVDNQVLEWSAIIVIFNHDDGFNGLEVGGMIQQNRCAGKNEGHT